jgi:hypothetical protein
VPYADAAANAVAEPPLGPSCAVGADAGVPSMDDAGANDSGAADAAPSIAPPPPPPRPVSMVVRDDAPVIYVADGNLPLIHVFQVGTAGLQEVAQYVATSVLNPSQALSVGQIALSPVTSDHRRYLYAIDATTTNSPLMVFDATAPIPTADTATPLRRPHALLNPFMAPDRIDFGVPVSAVAFATHDWPVVPPQVCGDGGCIANPNTMNAYTGLLCNPNLNALADGGGGFFDAGLGGYYRADFASTIQPQGTGVTGFPNRLRGVFAFATLSNGNLVTIDVDDWDAPCRRPDPMAISDGGVGVLPTGMTGVLAVPQPAPSGPDDLDPYHAPYTVPFSSPGFTPAYQTTGVTEEEFFPVSAPNRPRSSTLLRNDPATGNHTPNLVQNPQLFDSTGASFSAAGGTPPLIAPTALDDGFIDPTTITNPTAPTPQTFTSSNPALENSVDQASDAGVILPVANTPPGVRISFDDPTAQIDQNWSVTYEGALPTANGIADLMYSTDSYATLTLSPMGPPPPDAGSDAGSGTDGGSNGAGFCAMGIEDWSVGQQRVAAYAAALGDVGLHADPLRASYTGDYIEITGDLLPSNDPYWTLNDSATDCWDGVFDIDAGTGDAGIGAANASARYNFCLGTFGTSANADSTTSRDFPIIRATDNALTLGRFAWPNFIPEQTTNRTIVGANQQSNAFWLKRAACCFNKLVTYKVRAGGEWLATGDRSSLLHNTGVDPATGACVPRCDDPDQVLRSSRTIEVPPGDCKLLSQSRGSSPLIDRNSPLALRNPMFSFVLWAGCPNTSIDPNDAGVHTFTPRDASWKFQTRGGFAPVTVNLAGTTGGPVSPQSMLYIGPFGQMAIVDGSEQGLLLIDLNSLLFAHAPYL